jgi:hypothetical protein
MISRPLLLLVHGRRSLGHPQFEDVRESHADRLPVDELDRHAHLGQQESGLGPDQGGGDRHLVVVLRVQEVALAGVRVHEVHRLLLDRQLLQLQVGAEAVLPECAGGQILEAGVCGAPHLSLPQMVLGDKDLVYLPFET